MTHQRQSKGKAGATMTVAANMTTTMKKDQFLSNRTNEQQFMFMLSTKVTTKLTGDDDLLIVQKGVHSATSTTVLVGKDTDLIVLFCYHTSLDYHDIFFHLEPKKNAKKLHIWNIRAAKESLVKTSVTTSFSSMLFLGTSRLYGIGKKDIP